MTCSTCHLDAGTHPFAYYNTGTPETPCWTCWNCLTTEEQAVRSPQLGAQVRFRLVKSLERDN